MILRLKREPTAGDRRSRELASRQTTLVRRFRAASSFGGSSGPPGAHGSQRTGVWELLAGANREETGKRFRSENKTKAALGSSRKRGACCPPPRRLSSSWVCCVPGGPGGLLPPCSQAALPEDSAPRRDQKTNYRPSGYITASRVSSTLVPSF